VSWYVIVVVFANALMVTCDVTSTVEPKQRALGDSRHALHVPSASRAPSTPITIPPAPNTIPPAPQRSDPSATTSTEPPAASQPAVTDPPAALPSAPTPTFPATPLPSAPSRDQPLTPAIALAHPASNIPPSPNFLGACGSTTYSDSFNCVWDVVTAFDNARSAEGLPSMVLPTNWASLTPTKQIFVTTNLERTARGLAPVSALSTALDAAAAMAGAVNADPIPPAGFPWTDVASNWAGPVGNPLEAMYYWMYDDGFGSSNVDCSLADLAACWEHRQNVLAPLACNLCVMGGAFVTTSEGTISVTELIVETTGPLTTDFTWAQEEPYFS